MATLQIMKIFTAVFWEQILRSLIQISKRFSFSVIFLTLIAFLLFSELHNFNLFPSALSQELALLFTGGFLWFTSATLFSENRQWSTLKKYLILSSIFVIYFLKIHFYPKLSLETILLLSAILLSLSFFPRLFRKKDNASSWYFNYKIIAAIMFALLAALIFSGGMSLILVSVGYLFEFRVKGEFYGDVWIIGMLLFAPLYVLSQLPDQFDFKKEQCQFPKGVYFILNFVMVPLALIYMVILYAYFIKILFQWSLPHGHLGWMISVFGVIGILTHLAIYPVKDNNKPLIGWFYRNFYRVMIVPLILLFIAIGARIQQYGITENRYLVVICALWFSWLIINNLARRKNFQLSSVTLSLSILCLLSTFGPWGIKQLPISSQFSQFKNILSEQGLLKHGKLTKSDTSLDITTQKSLSSIALYLTKNEAMGKFRELFNEPEIFDKKLKCNLEKPCRSRDVKSLFELLGVGYLETWRSYPSTKQYISLTQPNLGTSRLLYSIIDYDYFIPLKWVSSNNEYQLIKLTPTGELQPWKIRIGDTSNLEILKQDEVLLIIDLVAYAGQFPKGENTKISFDDADKAILIVSQNGINAKLVITQVSFDNASGKTILDNLTGNLFLSIEEEL